MSSKTVIKPSQSWALEWQEILSRKELLYFFTWRNFKIRYKQTVIGALWAIIKPLVLMVVFTLFFNRALNVETGNENIPYPIFSYSGLLFWNYFSQTVVQVGGSLVAFQNVISKVYFPRLIIPISTSLTGLIDFGLSLLIFIGLLIYYGIPPEPLGILLFFPLVLVSFLTILGFGSFAAALNVRYRDVEQALPFIVQVLLFLTPVIYPVSAVPESWQWIVYLNPLSGVIELFRNSMFSGPLLWEYYAISFVSCILIFILGLWMFKKQERSIGDYI